MTQVWPLSTSILTGILLVFVLFAYAPDAWAQAIMANSVGFEKTTIIEFENSGNSDILAFRLWLGAGDSFKSFKTESGWSGTKSPQGVLIFTTSTPVKPGDMVKFGIKTDGEKPGVNWRALDGRDGQIGVGKTLTSDLPSIPSQTPDPVKPVDTNSRESGIRPDSSIRLIPDRPDVGGTIRIAGEKFSSNQEFDLYMNDGRLMSLRTDSSGSFIVTYDIPSNQAAGSTSFAIRDSNGNEVSYSTVLEKRPARGDPNGDIALVMSETPAVIYRGDTLVIGGSGTPGGSITTTITDPNGEIVTSGSTKIESGGTWTYDILTAIDAELGEYSATVTDGTDVKSRTWIVDDDQKIQLEPTKLKFEPGDVMMFNGTAIPNMDMEIIIENPQGFEIFSDVISIGESGAVSIEFDTTFADLEGTYVLFASQGDETSVALAGLGEPPKAQLVVKLDKINYDTGDVAQLFIDGPPSSTITLVVLSQADVRVFTDSVDLGHDGKRKYSLNLDGYKSEGYTLVLIRGSTQIEEKLSVGLGTGSGKVSIQTTKTEYLPGEPIIIIGKSDGNIRVILALMDPDGNEVKVKRAFTDKEGRITADSLRVPRDATPGTWNINARSGTNSDSVEFTVKPPAEDGITIRIVDGESVFNSGDNIKIQGFGATSGAKVNVKISIGDDIIETLETMATKEGNYDVPWIVPHEIAPGSYIITVTDINGNNSTASVMLG